MKYLGWIEVYLFVLLMQINKRTEIAACGARELQQDLIDNRIFYGHDAQRWPWHAAIYHQFNETDLAYKCGGTLVSSKFILTAAHCVLIAAENVSVSLGRQYLNEDHNSVQIIKAAEILTHPDYNRDNFENDIAIVTLLTEAILDNHVQPVCMWHSDKKDLSEIIGKLGIVVGWGLTAQGETSNALQQATLPVVSSITCLKSNPAHFATILSETNFCAGTRNGTGLCTGDSGGSITFKENGKFYIRGIVSIGASKPDQTTSKIVCDSIQYAVFTDVAQYLPWIAKTVQWENITQDPCTPSPCGENATCTERKGLAQCTCLSSYIGDPYTSGCRPECVSHEDCPSNFSCSGQRCQDPCIGTCGQNAVCSVVKHIPVCTCISPYIGDAYTSGCRPECVSHEDCPSNFSCTGQRCQDPCIGTCEQNAQCSVVKHVPVCTCISPYIGDAYTSGCRPECVSHEDCPSNFSCTGQRCQDPCIGTCGQNAQCSVVKHIPICTCISPYIGDAYTSGCRPECVSHEDCPSNFSCTGQRCQDPCLGACGQNAECSVVKHMRVCTCISPYIGDAYTNGCRPECVSHEDCPSNLSCTGQRCSDPCIGGCGQNAECSVVKHIRVCTCISPYIGDAYTNGCRPECVSHEDCTSNLSCTGQRCRDPCIGGCGQNAECSVVKHMRVCTCISPYIGDAYTNGCRPECVSHEDCPNNLSCIGQRCHDPCIGSCGRNAKCSITNHLPVCTCNEGFEGDATDVCRLKILLPKISTDPCDPSPCGPNSNCRTLSSSPVCSCKDGYSGSPPNCGRTETNLQTDPCNPSPCGPNSNCRILSSSPVCSCQDESIGSPPDCRELSFNQYPNYRLEPPPYSPFTPFL